MRSSNQSRQSEEQAIAAFNKEFDEEYNTIVTNMRSIAMGNTSFSNSWKEWLSIGCISASVVVTNGIFALLSALGLISPFVSLAVGFVVAVTGVVGGITYQRHRNSVNRTKYRNAVEFIETEMEPANVETFRHKMQDQLLPLLKISTPKRINQIVKAIMASLESMIVNRQVKSFDVLINMDMKALLSESTRKTAAVTMDTKVIKSLISEIPDPAPQSEVSSEHVDAALTVNQSEADFAAVSLSGSRQTLWSNNEVKELERQDELEQQAGIRSIASI